MWHCNVLQGWGEGASWGGACQCGLDPIEGDFPGQTGPEGRSSTRRTPSGLLVAEGDAVEGAFWGVPSLDNGLLHAPPR